MKVTDEQLNETIESWEQSWNPNLPLALDLLDARRDLAKYQETRVRDVEEKAYLSAEMTKARKQLAEAVRLLRGARPRCNEMGWGGLGSQIDAFLSRLDGGGQ